MQILRLNRQILAEIFRLLPLNKAKSKDLDHISGKTSLNSREIVVFPKINGIFTCISNRENLHLF